MRKEPRFILASSSPRRQQLLAYILPEFEVVPSHIDETASGPPEEQTVTLAADKAAEIAGAYPDTVVIGSDTLVSIDGEVLGKPQDKDEAVRMLRMLSGRTHKVYTGIAVSYKGTMDTACTVTEVEFDSLSESEIAEYIGTNEPMDKAGAYGIQGFGGKFIKGINGCYFNVMGLPLNTLYRMLQKINVL